MIKKEIIPGAVNWCLRVGYPDMSEWMLKLIEVKELQAVIDVEGILRVLCFRPNLMSGWLLKLRDWQLLESGLKSNLKFDCGDRQEQCGFITLLAFANFDFAHKEAPWSTELEELITKTRLEYLLDDFFGKSALYYAMAHGNSKSVRYILGKPEWKQKMSRIPQFDVIPRPHCLNSSLYISSSRSLPSVRVVEPDVLIAGDFSDCHKKECILRYDAAENKHTASCLKAVCRRNSWT